MTTSRLFTVIVSAAVTPVIALAIAACGGSGAATASPPASASKPAPDASTGATATVSVAHSSLGSILVDARGRTLYLWQADTGPTSACTGACAAAWPPLVTTRTPRAGSGVRASLLGITKRPGGTEQVTYKGHPLYRFTGDMAAGQINGEGSTGFGASWYVLSPAGNQITGSGLAAGPSSSYGY